MAAYGAALYQQDVIEELDRQAEVFHFGPGYPGYNPEATLPEVLAKAPWTPDLLLVGHSWLKDDANLQEIDSHPRMDFGATNLPKIGILNKEYSQLQKKLEFFLKGRFDRVFTHHHEVERYEKHIGIPHTFWPFGVNHRLFTKPNARRRPIDLAFSGILQNQNEKAAQTDTRIRVQSLLFHTFADVPLAKHSRYAGLNVYWSGLPRNRGVAKVAKALGKYRRLSLEEYIHLQQESKLFLNALSPMGLVSTRYFENMACGTLVYCEESPLYEGIFGKADLFVTFQSNLSDFAEKLFYYATHERERQEVCDRAYEAVMTHHTWEKRVASFLAQCSSSKPPAFAAP